MSYPYPLPTTGSLSFHDYVEPHSGYSSELGEANAQRGRLKAVLKELKKENQSMRDYQTIKNTIEGYLPYLVSIVNCIDAKELVLKKSVETSWRSTLSDHIIHTKSNAPRIPCLDIQYELIFVLMTYAYACSLQANDPNIADGDKLKASHMLNTAASIFSFVANNVVPTWKQDPKNRPVETIRDFCEALSKMAFADAQAFAIDDALSKNSFSKTFIAKLYIGVAEQYERAYGLISSMASNQYVSRELKRYLQNGAPFYKALAKKQLAIHEYEKSKNTGKAVGFATDCDKDLDKLYSSFSKVQIRKSTIEKEKEEVGELLRTYKNTNEKVAYEIVPSHQELQSLIPCVRDLLILKSYSLPIPAFGPSNDKGQEKPHALQGRYF